MRTVEEVAEEIWVNVDTREKVVVYDSVEIARIAQAVAAYAEERVKIVKESRCETSWAGGRAEALEEAAKVAEFHSGPSVQLAEKIRALKTTMPDRTHGGKP